MMRPLVLLALLTTGCGRDAYPPELTSPAPIVSEGTASAFDEARGEWVLLSAESLDDVRQSVTWVWRDGAWSVAGIAGPPRRRYPALAYDPARERVLLLGGLDLETNDPLADLWAWDGEGWSALTVPGGGPPPLTHHRLIWVPPRRALMLVGGVLPSCADGACEGQWWLGAEGWKQEL